MSGANKTQVGGNHYQSAFQHWDLVNSVLRGRYLEGCITKYVSRWRSKNGLQDLQKAEHYCQKLIETYSFGHCPAMGNDLGRLTEAELFCATNALGPYETATIKGLSVWCNIKDLRNVHTAIKELIEDAHHEVINHHPI